MGHKRVRCYIVGEKSRPVFTEKAIMRGADRYFQNYCDYKYGAVEQVTIKEDNKREIFVITDERIEETRRHNAKNIEWTKEEMSKASKGDKQVLADMITEYQTYGETLLVWYNDSWHFVNTFRERNLKGHNLYGVATVDICF